MFKCISCSTDGYRKLNISCMSLSMSLLSYTLEQWFSQKSLISLIVVWKKGSFHVDDVNHSCLRYLYRECCVSRRRCDAQNFPNKTLRTLLLLRLTPCKQQSITLSINCCDDISIRRSAVLLISIRGTLGSVLLPVILRSQHLWRYGRPLCRFQGHSLPAPFMSCALYDGTVRG